ncbi:SMI1/KNR4 family protein [Bacillus pseudomycoides]|uniref:SMI1/KNR4 family protein n=1 Tax=Bacillus pseudomycoides TaxID=64104 RepID=UPI000BF1A231|nr:SMI1/KNR4 family protein [Bacillus pseudomycoides]PEJ27544.1 SMI1/KNR4 family protein [Bacillus pseudomycoides]PHG34019.1 SMI1/KNR4 family protein [Bacillus pseudomycoides]
MVYKDIIKKIHDAPTDYDFSTLTDSIIEEESMLNGVPQDYISFLKEVGYGSVSNSYFMFYGGLIEADEIYDADDNPELKNVLLFCDNFSGDAIGFHITNNWKIIEIWHEDVSIVPREEKSFTELVQNIFSKEL